MACHIETTYPFPPINHTQISTSDRQNTCITNILAKFTNTFKLERRSLQLAIPIIYRDHSAHFARNTDCKKLKKHTQHIIMAESLIIAEGSKEEKYKTLVPQIKSLIEGEKDQIANLANITAAIQDTFHHLWVGFYIVKPAAQPTDKASHELVLGPFQGPIACTRIKKGRGVCGTAWLEAKTQVVPDVELFPGHIACSSRSKSEIVVPLFDNNKEVCGVLDIDSEQINTFDHIDAKYLEEICSALS